MIGPCLNPGTHALFSMDSVLYWVDYLTPGCLGPSLELPEFFLGYLGEGRLCLSSSELSRTHLESCTMPNTDVKKEKKKCPRAVCSSCHIAAKKSPEFGAGYV